MKTLAFILFVAFGIATSKAQQQDIETKSISIDNIINFVAENYPLQTENDIHYNNLTFAIQVSNGTIATEDLVILKQSFKLLSERLNENNMISIITYFGFSGTVLNVVSVKELDDINKALENLKGSIEDFKEDGIELAYQHAKKNYNDEAKNTIVIVRNTNASKPDMAKMSHKEKKKLKRKKRNKAILSTAIGLLPELISLLDK